MKKRLLLLAVFFLLGRICSAQVTFYTDYTPQSGPGYFWNSLMVNCPDGTSMVISDEFLDTTITLFKIDSLGNPGSAHKFTFPIQLSTIDVIILTDSSIALLLAPFNSPYCAVLMKVDPSGNLLWIEGLEVIGGATFIAFTPSTKGGMVLTGGGCSGHDMTLYIDETGAITNQVAHEDPVNPINIYTWGMETDGNDNFTGWGVSYVNVFHPLFYNIDSLGDFSNSTLFPDLTVQSSIMLPKTFITRSANGGHYCAFPLVDSALNNPGSLFYFNENNNYVWSKTISTTDSVITPTNVVGTSDNGVLLACDVYINGIFMPGGWFPYLPVFMKFDSSGTLEWTKMPGDTTLPGWRYLTINSVVSAPDHGYMCTLNNENGNAICKVDSLINGFCHNAMSYTNLTVANLNPAITYPVTQISHLNFTAVPFAIIDSQTTVFAQNECTTNPTGVQENGTTASCFIYPNPSQGLFNFITGESKSLVEIYNSLYQIVYSSNADGNKIPVDLRDQPDGIYFLRATCDGKEIREKVIISGRSY